MEVCFETEIVGFQVRFLCMKFFEWNKINLSHEQYAFISHISKLDFIQLICIFFVSLR